MGEAKRKPNGEDRARIPITNTARSHVLDLLREHKGDVRALGRVIKALDFTEEAKAAREDLMDSLAEYNMSVQLEPETQEEIKSRFDRMKDLRSRDRAWGREINHVTLSIGTVRFLYDALKIEALGRQAEHVDEFLEALEDAKDGSKYLEKADGAESKQDPQ